MQFTPALCKWCVQCLLMWSSVAVWLMGDGSNWRFWYNPFLLVPNSPIITGTIFVLTFHILLILISRSLYLFSFSVSFVLKFESSGMAVSISRQVFSYLSCNTLWGQFASIVWSVITNVSHMIVVRFQVHVCSTCQ